MGFNSLDRVKSPELPDSPDSIDSISYQPVKKQGILKWGLGLLALLLMGGGMYLTYRQFAISQQRANPPMRPVPVERANLSITVSANGNVEPDRVVNVSPKAAGILKSLLVEEGDFVRKGQVLGRMDDSNLQGQLTQARGRLEQAEANLRKLVAGNRPQEIAQAQAKLEELEANLRKLIAGNRSQDIAQAKARLESAQANYIEAEDDFRRNQQLKEAGAISQQALNIKQAERDTAQAAVEEAKQALSLQKVGTRQEDIDLARAQVEQQRQALDLLKAGTRQEEIDEARAEVTAARGDLQSIQTEINDTILRAPFDGVVMEKFAEPGSFVTPMTSGSSVSSATSSSLLALANTNLVTTNVSESSISQIRLGQAVEIEADAYPGKTFPGRVSKISPQAAVEQNVTSFEVEIALISDSKKLLRSGMNVSVVFQVGQLQDALTVPTIAVTRQNDVTGVYVGDKGKPPRFVPITTGTTVDNQTEVKSGLNGTEMILISEPSKPQDRGFSFQNIFGGSSNDGPPGGGPPGGGPPGGGGGGGPSGGPPG